MTNTTITVILTIIFIVYIYLLFRNLSYTYTGPQYPFTAETADFEILKKVCIDKVEKVKNESGLFQPYNNEIMDNVESVIRNAKDLKELAIASLLMPNNCIGLGTIEPLSGNPIDSTIFQFEQGNFGWYWGYSTYTNPICNIMYYIIRIELGTKDIREKYNLPLGSTTIYSISLGIGNNGVWKYTPYIVCGGKYEIFDNKRFRFSATFDKDVKGYTVFQTTDNGLKLDMGWSDIRETPSISDSFSKGKDSDIRETYDYESSTLYELTSPMSPSFNGIDGCAPCFSGIGTLYWSYTDFKCSSYIKTPKGILNVINGDGWLDHQWMRSNNTKNIIDRIILNTLSLSNKGFGRYIWINLHIKNTNKPFQCMVYTFPDKNVDIKEGLTFKSTYNLYSKYYNNILNRTDGTIKILKTTVFEGITYATLVSINLNDFDSVNHTYIVDCSPYGNCATIDFTGNYHWTSSAILSEDTRNTIPSGGNSQIGTAFLEQNQFQNPRDYRQTTLNIGNFRSDVINIDETKLSSLQILPSYIALIPIFIFLIIIIIFVFKKLKNLFNKNL